MADWACLGSQTKQNTSPLGGMEDYSELPSEAHKKEGNTQLCLVLSSEVHRKYEKQNCSCGQITKSSPFSNQWRVGPSKIGHQYKTSIF